MTRKIDGAGTSANPLTGLAPPGVPPELKARVLAASRAALLAEPSRPDRWSVLWASRPLRLAWAASVLLLLAGHAVLVRPDSPQNQAAAPAVSRSVNEADAELAAIGHLPRLDPDARPLGASPVRPSQHSLPPEPEQPEENRT
jgi:hypothetical protein